MQVVIKKEDTNLRKSNPEDSFIFMISTKEYKIVTPQVISQIRQDSIEFYQNLSDLIVFNLIKL